MIVSQNIVNPVETPVSTDLRVPFETQSQVGTIKIPSFVVGTHDVLYSGPSKNSGPNRESTEYR